MLKLACVVYCGMARICQHEFERRDSTDPDYSHMEVDLAGDNSLSIRKNHAQDQFEIFDFTDGSVEYTGTFQQVVSRANTIEEQQADIEDGTFTIECHSTCPCTSMHA